MDAAQVSGEGKTSPLDETEAPKNPVISEPTNPKEEPSTSSSPVRQESADKEKTAAETVEGTTSGVEETAAAESKAVDKTAGAPSSGTKDLQPGPVSGAKLGHDTTAAVENPIVAEKLSGATPTPLIISSNVPSSTSVTLTSSSASSSASLQSKPSIGTASLQGKTEVEHKPKSSTAVTLVSGGKVAPVTSSIAGATVTLSSSSTVGMKRPSSDIIASGSTLQSTSVSKPADQAQADSDSSTGDPKRKKMRKAESDSPMNTTGVPSPGPAGGQGGRVKSGKQGKSSSSKEKHIPSGDSAGPHLMEIDQDTGADKAPPLLKVGDSLSSSAAAAPKVPPIKIVLQSHGSHSNSAASVSNGGEQDGPTRQTTSPSGFPYVVSTSPDNPSGSPGARDSSSPSQVPNTGTSQASQVPGSSSAVDTTINVPISSSSELRTEAITPPLTSDSQMPPAEGSGANLSASSSPTRPNSGDRPSQALSPDQGALILSLNEKDNADAEKSKDSASSTGLSAKEEKSNGKESKFTGFASISGSGPASNSSGSYTDEKTEKPQRVTRSSLRTAHGGSGQTNTGTPNSPSGSPKGSPSPNQQDVTEMPPAIKQEPIDEGSNLDHPKKRKPKTKADAQQPVAATTPPEPLEVPASTSTNTPEVQPILNCFEMYFNIRKQIDQRRKSLFPVTPKPPQGFKDYLMNRGSYVLASNANKSRVAVPILNPPPTLSAQMKELFIDQEKDRHKLRIQHLIEKEKLVLSVEQEILRVHGRAARALSNQALPFSVCTILKDQEVYNLLTPEQEEKDRNARSRYNGRLFLSWLQDVDDKWDKIKESMLLRHHNEAESLHAVQKMDWEWKLKEVGLCEPKAAPIIDDIQVPMVHVSDDFDLLPA